MFGVGLWGLERGTMWRDEAVTFEVAQRSLPQIWQLLHNVDAVHGLYYLLMHFVLGGNPGEVALRLPSVCAAAVTAGLVAAIGARLARPRVGLWAGLLYAATPMAGYYAQEGRSYAMVAAGAALATLILLHAVHAAAHARVRWWSAYGAVVALTALLHELSILLLLAHAVTLLVSRVPRRVWCGWGCAAAAAVLALLPLALASIDQSGQVAWLTAPDGADAEHLLRAFAGPDQLVLAVHLLLAAVALRAPLPRVGGDRAVTDAAPTRGGAAASRVRVPSARAGGTAARTSPARYGGLSLNAVAVPLVLLPPAVLFAVSQYWPLYDARYVLFALAGAPLLAAAGAERVASYVGLTVRTRSRAHGRADSRGRANSRSSRTSTGGSSRTSTSRSSAASSSVASRSSGASRNSRRTATTRGTAPRGSAAAQDKTPARNKTAARDETAARRRAAAQVRVRACAGAAAGVLAVVAGFCWQLPLHRHDRTAGHRPDDLGAMAAVAARLLRPGDPVLFLPSAGRRTAEAYPKDFQGAYDVALKARGRDSGTLYGLEEGPEELWRRLAMLDHVWVLAESAALRPAWSPKSPTERAKLAALQQGFVPQAEFERPWGVLRLYVRRPAEPVGAQPGPVYPQQSAPMGP
ncbi:glycosyltransferase family 39 protein [Streptomyces jeddahensis]|nr:glycosyltransferase family 39 protein [Streptomyces jeddahensis]